jgi:hypothetical protein
LRNSFGSLAFAAIRRASSLLSVWPPIAGGALLDIRQLLPGAVLHDKAGFQFID